MWFVFSWLRLEFPCLVWKFQYCVQVIPLLGSVLSHLNPFRTRTNTFFKIHLIIVLPSKSISLSYSGSSIYYFIWIYFSQSHYQSERNKWRWLQSSCFLSSYFSQYFNVENYLTLFYFYFFGNFANNFPVFPTLLTVIQHCTWYTVRWRKKKHDCQMSLSRLIMHNTHQYISRTPSDRSRKSQISALRLVHYTLLARVW